MLVRGLAGVDAHQGRDIVRPQPEFDLPFRILGIRGRMNQIVDPVANDSSIVIHDLNHRAERADAAGILFAGNVGIGGPRNRSNFRDHVLALIHKRFDSAFCGG